jgi:hypothetical protein
LINPEMLVEIEADAIVGEEDRPQHQSQKSPGK